MTGESKVWVVVPVYNERAALRSVLDRLALLRLTTVVVDDGSDDGSGDVRTASGLWLVRHAINLGQGAAIQTGIRFALSMGADVIVTFDSDGQHDTADIGALVSALNTPGVEFALGSRFLGAAPGIPWTRVLTLRLGVIFTRLLSGIAITDTHNGLRAMTRRGAECINLTLNRMEHASEFLDQVVASGLRYTEVPVCIRYTRASLARGQKSGAAVRIAAKLLVERI